MKYDLAHVFYDGARGVCHAVVLVPLTQELRERGLRGLRQLQDGRGMLFSFPRGRPSLTMTEMLFPIDIAFVAKGRLMSVERALPGQPRIDGPADATIAIEMPARYFARHEIYPGSPVLIRS